jgi:polysaccharide pyruvyl transferase WcaK-like protein
MRHVHLIDTSVASDNIGDEIIVAEARRALQPLLADAYVTTSSGHDGLGHYGRKLAHAADVVLVLGTNALNPDYQLRGHFIWALSRRDLPVLEGKVVLLGVGANRDFDRVSWRQRRLLRRLLSPRHLHSVRDATGKRLLDEVGVASVNTSCPTLWRYADAPPQLPEAPAPEVCFTLTKHKPHASDAVLVAALRKVYPRLHFWPQQPRDLDYLHTLAPRLKLDIVAPNLAAYDALLAGRAIDVVGTRLHGCIRGLMHGRRVLAVAIDNRARDIGQETGLPVLPREAVEGALAQRLAGRIVTRLTVPRAPVEQFLAQFRPGGGAD